MKVLLTGASGQLARLAAIQLLAEGHDVVGMDVRRRPHPDVQAPFEYVKRYDHRTVAEVFREHRPDAMIHLGVRAGGFQAEAKSRYTQNVLGTRHLLELSVKHRLRRVIVLGTFHVYGAHPHNPTFLAEDAPLATLQEAAAAGSVEPSTRISASDDFRLPRKLSASLWSLRKNTERLVVG